MKLADGAKQKPMSPVDGAPAVLVLLGAGRGGTTLLYKLLALHRDVGYLSNYQQRFPRVPATAVMHRLVRDRHAVKLEAWFQADGGAYFQGRRQRLQAMVPTPFEGEGVYAACGIPRWPARGVRPDSDACRRLRETLRRIQRWAGAQVVVTKRTANNRRVAWLETAFPQARYVHLIRDGRAVARSLLVVHWWSDHTLFWAGQTPARLVEEGHDELELAARNWVEELAEIRVGLSAVPSERILTVRYERLLESPHSVLADVLDFVGIPAGTDAGFDAAIDRVGLRPRTTDWARGLSDAARARLEALQSEELARWGYLEPRTAGRPT